MREQDALAENDVVPYEGEVPFSVRRPGEARMMIANDIGTDRGVSVKVDTKNPKTKDGKNTIIFRRDWREAIENAFASDPIDASSNPIPKGVVVGEKNTPYTGEEKKRIRKFVIAQAKAQTGDVKNAEFGNIRIGSDFVDEVSTHAISTAREIMAVSSARDIASRMVHLAASPNEELVKRNGINMMEYGVAKVKIDDDVYLVMGEVGVRNGSTPYYDQRVVAKLKADSTPALRGDNRIESAFDAVYDNRFRMILQGGKLLSEKHGKCIM